MSACIRCACETCDNQRHQIRTALDSLREAVDHLAAPHLQDDSDNYGASHFAAGKAIDRYDALEADRRAAKVYRHNGPPEDAPLYRDDGLCACTCDCTNKRDERSNVCMDCSRAMLAERPSGS